MDANSSPSRDDVAGGPILHERILLVQARRAPSARSVVEPKDEIYDVGLVLEQAEQTHPKHDARVAVARSAVARTRRHVVGRAPGGSILHRVASTIHWGTISAVAAHWGAISTDAATKAACTATPIAEAAAVHWGTISAVSAAAPSVTAEVHGGSVAAAVHGRAISTVAVSASTPAVASTAIHRRACVRAPGVRVGVLPLRGAPAAAAHRGLPPKARGTGEFRSAHSAHAARHCAARRCRSLLARVRVQEMLVEGVFLVSE